MDDVKADPLEDARRLLEDDMTAREEAFLADFGALRERHGCDFRAFINGGPVPPGLVSLVAHARERP